MTEGENQAQAQPQDNKPSDKEYNFRTLEAKYRAQLEQERQARLDAERKAQELESKRVPQVDEEEDDEPYVDRKRLKKEQERLSQKIRQDTQTDIQKAIKQAIYEDRQQNWLKQNADFHEVMQHADKFAEKNPELAETILEMPEGFERQKLVYKNIKALGLNKPAEKQSSVQDKIDANKRSPYYQPSGVGAAPYAGAGDFSTSGQKNAYNKMQELKSRLRLG